MPLRWNSNRVCCHWLDDPKAFGGEHRLPSVTRDDPAYHDNVYWRGRDLAAAQLPDLWRVEALRP